MLQKRLLFLMIFLVYVIGRVGLSLPAFSKPKELPDTMAYLRISQEPLLSEDFWGSSRPFVFPLFLKMVQQNMKVTAAIQLAFSMLSWGLLAIGLSSFILTPWLAFLSFIWILAMSLIPRLAGWDFTMLSESLSISWFILFLACGLFLLKGWRWERLLLVCAAGFFMAFTRDTNAYLLLFVAILLLMAVFLGWTDKRIIILSAVFVMIFVLNNATVDLGRRWVFPLINVMGRRVLPDPEKVDFLQSSCEMPVSSALINMRNEFANGQERAFYLNPQLEGFRVWLASDGKQCYARLLLSDPVHNMSEPLTEFNGLVTFRKLQSFLPNSYDPIIPFAVEPLFYPVRQAHLLWIILSLVTIGALFLQPWRLNSLWSIFILLSGTIFPHLFISWHGDSMAPERHAVLVGLQLALSSWILVMLLLDTVINTATTKS